MNLRDYQAGLVGGVYDAWTAGAQNVVAVLPTGGGKTVCFSRVIHDERGPATAIAHRQELVGQIALTLARDGIPHRVLAPESVIRQIVAVQMIELGRTFYNPRARVTVAGVDTLIRRPSDPCFDSTLWVMDEAHHVLTSNKWGKAVAMFPRARGLGVTATEQRADGRGIGVEDEGVFGAMVEGPHMRELIDRGFLTDYRVFAPPSHVDLSGVDIGAAGDYSGPQLRRAMQKAKIVGDVVEHYLRLARGKRGVTFAVDVAAAAEILEAYRAAGVPSELVTADTPDAIRAATIRKFRAGELLQLVNVDLFGEGFDLPAIEVVSMARPTASYPLFVQQFGRALRPLEGKDRAIILDHVGNVLRHGFPDAPRDRSLAGRERRGNGAAAGVISLRVCNRCMGPYERVLLACPYCGEVPVPAGRSRPEEVDGDLAEVFPDVVAGLQADADRAVGAPRIPSHLTGPAARGAYNAQVAKANAQTSLRETMALYGGWRLERGDGIREAQKRFFLEFGVDVLSAQALGAREADELRERIDAAVNSAVGCRA